jgi:hypothetical protein
MKVNGCGYNVAYPVCSFGLLCLHMKLRNWHGTILTVIMESVTFPVCKYICFNLYCMLTEFRLLRWLIIDINSVLGPLHCVDV